jgi:hypothetical protein
MSWSREKAPVLINSLSNAAAAFAPRVWILSISSENYYPRTLSKKTAKGYISAKGTGLP